MSQGQCSLLVVKNPLANAGDVRDVSSVPGWGRSPGGVHGNPLQDSCLENPMDRGAWWATVHGVATSWTRLKRLGTNTVPAFCRLSRGVDAWLEAPGKSVPELEPGPSSWPVSMGLHCPFPSPKEQEQERSHRPRSGRDQPKFDGAPVVLTC